MRCIFTFIFSTLFFLLPHAQEKVYTVDNLMNVHRMNWAQYVINPDKILTQESCDSIDAMLFRLEKETGIESVVAVVSSIGDVECFDFSHQLLNKWGVGKKGKDNGFIILMVTDQRCIQFYTGYGLEGILPDAICKRIQTKYMIPYLKDGNWNEGMVAGVKATCQVLDGSMENDTPANTEDDSFNFYLICFVLFILLIGTVKYIVARKLSRCPRCKKHKLKRTGSRIISNSYGQKEEIVTYTCSNCGYQLERRQKIQNNNYRGGGGPFVGGFGGGSGGGGGAGSRF